MPSPSRESLNRGAAMALFALVVAVCLFLVFGSAPAAKAGAAVSASGKWTCSMCPQFILPQPGKCPKCFMDLIPLEEGASAGGRRELILSRDAAQLAGIAGAHLDHAIVHDGDGEEESVLVVPESAVLRNLGRTFVFLESEADDSLSYTLQEIEIGGKTDKGPRVVNGLFESDKVAVSGLFRIDSALQILGKTSLANLPDGDLSQVDDETAAPFQPADRSSLDLRKAGFAVDDWFGQYERVRAALAKDDFAASRAPARELADALAQAKNAVAGSADEFAELYGRLSADADALSGADGLEPARSSFDKMSADMVLLARRYGTPGGGLNLIFCPMAFGGTGSHWLQPAETVDNPYHGLEMPTCGWKVESIE